MQEGSIPSMVIGFVALLLVLFYIRVVHSKLSGFGNRKEVLMTENQNIGVRSVLDTIWAVGAGYLAGALPT